MLSILASCSTNTECVSLRGRLEQLAVPYSAVVRRSPSRSLRYNHGNSLSPHYLLHDPRQHLGRDRVRYIAVPTSLPNTTRTATLAIDCRTISLISGFLCGRRHRKGVLWTKCAEGYASGPLSYDHSCAKCNTPRAARWIIFFIQQFVPVTVFFFAVLIFRLKMTTQPAFILFAQVYSSAGTVRVFRVISTHTNHSIYVPQL